MSKKVFRVFLECFNEDLFCDFVVALISLQLPGQKKGLFRSQSNAWVIRFPKIYNILNLLKNS